jgi:CRP-like cAMP-binding protein
MGVQEKAVLTLDIVNFSQIDTNEKQLEVITALIGMLRQAVPNPKTGLWSPAGDGGSFTFMEDNNAAVHTAIRLGALVKEHNEKPGVQQFELRMGIHIGPVYKETDFDERENVWGNGINLSARVASLARPKQILISANACESLSLKRWGTVEVTEIGKRWAKHELSLDLYNIYSKEKRVGIPPADLEGWYSPFHQPLQQAIEMYEAILEYEIKDQDAFRTLMVAKRLLDLQPKHERAEKTIKRISSDRGKFERNPLYHGFFSALSPSALLYFFNNAIFHVFGRNHVIAREGEPATSLMMVVSGEVVPLIGGERLVSAAMGRDDGRRESQNIVMREGEIVGEMGLFSPGGKRAATLEAIKDTITLTLEYRSLEDAPGTKQNDERCEIRKHIWTSYRDRTKQNAINRDPLFQELLKDDPGKELLVELLAARSTVFLPDEPDQPIRMGTEEAWDSWIIVVAGKAIAYTTEDKCVEYGPGERRNCLGPVRLVKDQCQYSRIEFTPGTQIVRLPWSAVQAVTDQHESFGVQCLSEGRKDRTRYSSK